MKNSYNHLVQTRKECRTCDQNKVCNLSAFEGEKFDSNEHLTPWSRWQSHPEPLVLVVGQDWTGQEMLRSLGGAKRESIARHGADVSLPTNKNLRLLLQSIGLDPGSPDAPLSAELHFTNMLLCLKSGGISEGVSRTMARTCAERFFVPLVRTLAPKAIVCLGATAYEGACRALGMQGVPKLSDHVNAGGRADFPDFGTSVFGAFHCGGLGTAQRPLPAQVEDWKRIGEFLQNKTQKAS